MKSRSPTVQDGGGTVFRLYPSLIFLSAFLAFVVQPMEGKKLLPWFGGASSVWATGLLFFTGLLFLGYLYVFLLTRLGGKRQLSVHRVVVLSAIVATLLPLLLRGKFQNDLGWAVDGDFAPGIAVLLALLLSVGPPFFLLATTAPLLQYWWGRLVSREPYRLYSLSNLGSLLALLLYPVLIEPHLSLPLQRGGWFLLFAIYGGLYLYVTFLLPDFGREDREGDGGRIGATRGKGAVEHRRPVGIRGQPESGIIGATDAVAPDFSWVTCIAWMACAAIPAFLLVAVTMQITQVVAPVPLLWTVPLALYLVSFILAFRGIGRSVLLPMLVLAAVGFVLWAESGDRTARAELQVLAALFLLFASGWALHARLYAMRPSLAGLPGFYLMLSLGGVIGTLGASLLPPILFPDLWEYPLGVALAGGGAGVILSSLLLKGRSPAGVLYLVQLGCLVLAGFGFIEGLPGTKANRIAISRNFYGTAMVSLEGDFVVLSHGMTRHGSQFNDPERAPIPTAYYAPTSGVGRAAVYLQERAGSNPVRFGLVGLGAGTLAAYCRPGDTVVFYELDPRITSFARRYFSYLEMCPGVAVRHGDARMILENERTEGSVGMYDLLAVDAFSDDAVPVHLLTLEAFQLYLDHLAPDGVLAVHTSNVYIELAPVVTRIAEELGWSSMVVRDWEQSSPGAAGSDWVLLTENPVVFQAAAFATTQPYHPVTRAPLWTDAHSSILPLLRGYQHLIRRFRE